MFEIGIIEEFEAVLSLKGDFGLATRLHGHAYKVQVVVHGDTLNETGVLYDISRLRDSLREILSHLHYQNLNELEEFRELNPTVENVCKYIYNRMALAIGGEVGGLKVTVWESPTAFASYDGE
jgi:6-pyruvoyltetrahydropterin/6-carboxytetrahydropterin synthase